MKELDGRVAVITGGASGIGFATAKQFAKKGINLVLADIEEEPLEEAVVSLSNDGATVIGVQSDVANLTDVESVRDAALARFGAVHIVFNNAGVGGGSVINTPPAVWDWVLGVNVDGVVNGISVFMPLLLEQNEGHVINTGSLAGLGGVPGMGPYCASKFAVVGLSESLFYELEMRHSDVHCSVLCPAFVKTRIHESERNIPTELASWSDQPETKAIGDFARQAVLSGIEPSVVAEQVTRALTNENFWILPHQSLALATTKRRMEWMDGGDPPRLGL